MQFTVPKFIEKKAKIVGPLTFQQLIFVGTAGVICFFLYFFVPMATFIIAATLILVTAGVLAFVKIEGTSLPVVIKNLFIFVLRPKIYLWKKKTGPFKILKKTEEKEEKTEKEEESTLKIAEHSRLKELSTRLEIKSK